MPKLLCNKVAGVQPETLFIFKKDFGASICFFIYLFWKTAFTFPSFPGFTEAAVRRCYSK